MNSNADIERENVGARWFVDGKDTFAFMSDAINKARKEIFICGETFDIPCSNELI